MNQPEIAEPYCVAAYTVKDGDTSIPRVCVRGEGHEGMHMAWVGRRCVSWNDQGERFWSGGANDASVAMKENRVPNIMLSLREQETSLEVPIEIPLNESAAPDVEVTEALMKLPFSRLRKTNEQG